MSIVINGKELNEWDYFLIASALKTSAKSWRELASNSLLNEEMMLDKAKRLEEWSEFLMKEGQSLIDKYSDHDMINPIRHIE